MFVCVVCAVLGSVGCVLTLVLFSSLFGSVWLSAWFCLVHCSVLFGSLSGSAFGFCVCLHPSGMRRTTGGRYPSSSSTPRLKSIVSISVSLTIATVSIG